MILIVYTILCILVAIFGFIYCACVVSSNCERKEEEENEEINFICNSNIDDDFWNDNKC